MKVIPYELSNYQNLSSVFYDDLECIINTNGVVDQYGICHPSTDYLDKYCPIYLQNIHSNNIVMNSNSDILYYLNTDLCDCYEKNVLVNTLHPKIVVEEFLSTIMFSFIIYILFIIFVIFNIPLIQKRHFKYKFPY